MKVLGVITEYNPFHNGHRYHLEKSREITGCDATLAVMSGHFLQRGEPALLDKWRRGEMAVQSGVDLVLEIPTVYACSTAEFFSYGSIQLLHGTGIVTDLSFGSEHGTLPLLQKVAGVLAESPPSYEALLQEFLNQGLPFPVARSKALSSYMKQQLPGNREDFKELEKVLKSPNNILAIEYLKTLINTESPITPHTIKRISAGYHDRRIRGSIASATGIREHLASGKDFEALTGVLPQASLRILKSAIDQGFAPVFPSNIENLLLGLLRRATPEDLRRIFDVTEGIENRLWKGAKKSTGLGELLEQVKTKRYTYTRIQRILMHLLLDLSKEDLLSFNRGKGPKYLRVLAFNDRGRKLLKKMQKESSLPVITNLKHYEPQTSLEKSMLAYDLRGTDLYTLGMPGTNLKTEALEYKKRPVYVKG